MQSSQHRNPIDKMSHSGSVIDLLSLLNLEKLPSDERIAVASVQVEALEEWLAANLDSLAERTAAHPG
jgi:hypothetical protein